MKHQNQIRFRHMGPHGFIIERLHIRYWMYRVYVNEVYGKYVPRVGGWA